MGGIERGGSEQVARVAGHTTGKIIPHIFSVEKVSENQDLYGL